MHKSLLEQVLPVLAALLFLLLAFRKPINRICRKWMEGEHADGGKELAGIIERERRRMKLDEAKRAEQGVPSQDGSDAS